MHTEELAFETMRPSYTLTTSVLPLGTEVQLFANLLGEKWHPLLCEFACL